MIFGVIRVATRGKGSRGGITASPKLRHRWVMGFAYLRYGVRVVGVSYCRNLAATVTAVPTARLFLSHSTHGTAATENARPDNDGLNPLTLKFRVLTSMSTSFDARITHEICHQPLLRKLDEGLVSKLPGNPPLPTSRKLRRRRMRLKFGQHSFSSLQQLSDTNTFKLFFSNEPFQVTAQFLSASLYVSKRGAY